MSKCHKFVSKLLRLRKAVNFESDSTLRRCMSTLDLTVLGVGTVVGAGLYVVAGELARDVAGPAVIISFFIASVAAFLSGLCYAEFGSRIPKAGSAYTYTYIVLGEFIAFVVGWNMILEYLLGAASLARSCSEYINSVFGGVIYNFFQNDIASWHLSFLGPFPDFLAFGIALVVTVIVCLGVRQSSIFNKITTFINFTVITIVIISGLYLMNINNWSKPGEFAPYGVSGILTAAGSAFFAFVGFDAIATAGEEAINPRRSLPLSIVLCLVISFLAYFGVAAMTTLIVPYHKLSKFAPLAEAFATRGFPAGKYIVTIGAICATICCLLCHSFAAPRVVYSMASDGLLFRFFANVNQRTQVPIRAAVCDFFLIGTLAILLDVRQLVEMLSIGTLTAYSFIAIGVLLTRYQPGVQSVIVDDDLSQTNKSWLKKLCCANEDKKGESNAEYEALQKFEKSDVDDDETISSTSSSKSVPTSESFCRASLATASLVFSIFGFSLTLTLGFASLQSNEVWAIVLASVFCIGIVVSWMVLERQPRSAAEFPFMVPGCPYVPSLSLFINVTLLVKLKYWTYVRFGIWLVIGCLIYGFYGYRHSVEGLESKSEEDSDYIISPTPPIEQRVQEMQPNLESD